MKLPLIISLFLAIAFAVYAFNPHPQLLPMLNFNNHNNDGGGGDHQKEWLKIDSLDNQGLTQDALKMCEELYQAVSKEENPAQLVKVLTYIGKYKQRLEEDGLVKSINWFAEEAAKAKFPAKEILISMQAEMYDRYLQNNRYKFSNRTTVSGDFKQEDISTWDMTRLSAKISELYWASIKNEDLKRVRLGDFKAITENTNEGDNKLRPTLYDFLTFRALAYFSDEANYLTQPAYQFYIDQPVGFGTAEEFVNTKFVTKDSTSQKFQALQLYQALTKFRLQDTDNQEALIDLELNRLAYIKENSVLPEKEDLYFAALEKLEKRAPKSPETASVLFAKANYYSNQAGDYQVTIGVEHPHKWSLKKAVELCDKAVATYPKSYGAENCEGLKQTILNKSLAVVSEKQIPLSKSFLMKMTLKNLTKVHVKVVRIPDQDVLNPKTFRNDYYREYMAYLNGLKPDITNFEVNVPDEGDYNLHDVTFKVGGIQAAGRYAVMVSDKADFSYSENGVAVSMIDITNLAMMHHDIYSAQHDLYVMDRVSGKPLAGVKVELYRQTYEKDRYVYKLAQTLTTDKDSKVTVPTSDNSYSVKLINGKDFYFTGESVYAYNDREDYRDQTTTHFFTDRAIYRPGQTVYFKGIVVTNNTKTPNDWRINKNSERNIVFRDANYQEVARVKLRTNDYGSFQGTFTAPTTGMTGQMTLHDEQADNGYHYFNVEEYKRPKFEVGFEPIKESYRIADKVTVTGTATAFAGSNIDGGKVEYRVIRKTRFPYWCWWYWGWYNPWQREEVEILNGTTETDTEGKFKIVFDALADRTIPKDKKPVFYYTVKASVTDMNGETHESETEVSVGYIAIEAGVNIAESVEKDSLKAIEIYTRNLNGEKEPTKGTLKIEKLKTPDVIYHEPIGSSLTGKILMSEADYKKEFPTYPYKDEHKIENYTVEKLISTENFDTKNTEKIPVTLQEGVYKLTLNTADKYGEKIETVNFVTVHNSNSANVSKYAGFEVFGTEKTYQPGDKAVIRYGSGYKNAWVLVRREHLGKLVSIKWEQLNGMGKLEIPIEEQHRGNTVVQFATLQDNQFFSSNELINVPWTNKDLKIEYQTFRDKLLPGQDEEWRIKISGMKGDKVAAEVLATMYDASLDEFATNYFSFYLFGANEQSSGFSSNSFSKQYAQLYANEWTLYNSGGGSRYYPSLNWFGFEFYEYYNYRGDGRMYKTMAAPVMAAEGAVMEELSAKEKAESPKKDAAKKVLEQDADGAADVMDKTPGGGEKQDGKDGGEGGKAKPTDFGSVKVRTNLNETVFFYPQLMTDAEGSVIIKFKMNEALTKWKFMALAHTQDLKSAISTNFVKTQKDLMVMPNPPRFMRENDKMEFSAKVSNLAKTDLTGTARLYLFDAVSMKPLDDLFKNKTPEITFNAKAGQSAPLLWNIEVPDGYYNAITWRVVAKAGDFSDGEESALPVVTNRMLVMESMPLPVRGGMTKNFDFKRMSDLSKSTTLRNHKLTLEFTPNPAWYAVQALPYIMEYPYECTEQVFSRFYANSIASHVANSHPKVKKVFDSWKGTDAMLSNLDKNEELKYALLEETPWVLDAQDEKQQKANIAVLFDLNRMSNEMSRAVKKISERQQPSGGFVWFGGNYEDYYMTQYIAEGVGHLQKMGIKVFDTYPELGAMAEKAVRYCDNKAVENYNLIRKEDLDKDNLSYFAMHYLYMRTFYTDGSGLQSVGMSAEAKKMFDYYLGQAEKYWLGKGLYGQGMLALAAKRQGKTVLAQSIVKALKQNSLNSEEMGMYWKYPSGWWWYEMPIETHSLMIEVFQEVAHDEESVEALRTWLLKNKQTNRWNTTKSTATAVYALLLSGDNWLLEDKEVSITMGGTPLDQSKLQKEAGTGYFKTSWNADQIKPEMGKITVSNPNKVPAWGALYWQYFEQLDKITYFKETPLKIDKKLFKQVNSDRGPVLNPINDGDKLSVGDLIKVRIELRVDREMEYVHMKDMRAAGFEPTSVLSEYKYQGGLGYFESTRDLATNFFFSYLPKGTFVFEYSLRVSHRGNFSNGVTYPPCKVHLFHSKQ